MMNANTSRSLLAVLVLVTLGSPAPTRAAVSAEVSVGFEAGLAPYGEWIVVPHQGRVWRPRHVAAGWRPYFHGRWVWTDDGWFWDSDEPWGWAVYHYGRWYVDPVYGWLWVPGSVWAPAWVSWRFGVGAIGWAPLLPGFSVWWSAGYPVQYSSWCFVPTRRFAGVRVESVAFAPARSAVLFSRTQFAPPRSVSGSAPRLGGPPRTFVERQMGRRIAPVRIAAASSPQAARGAHGAGVVSVYRPAHAGMGRSTTHASAPHAPQRHAAAAHAPQRHAATARPTARAGTGHSHASAAARRSPQHVAPARAARHAPNASPARRAAAPRSAGPHAGAGSTPRHAPAAGPHRSAPTHAPSSAQGRTAPRHASSSPSRPGPQPHASAGHAGPQPRGSARAAPSQHGKRETDRR